MHLFKIDSRPLLLPLALSFCLAASSLAQPAAPSPAPARAEANAKTPASVPGESRELMNARMDLSQLLNRVDENHPDARAQMARIAMLEKLEPKKISIDFAGGSIDQFVRQVSTIEGVTLNVISASPRDLQLAVLPKFSLRNVSLITVVEVARSLLSRQFSLDFAGPVEQNSVVCVLRQHDVSPRSPSASAFDSFQLTPYLAEQTVDQVVAAIRTAWELEPGHTADAMRVKFHEPTAMLLISGPPEAVDIARNVLSKMKGAPARPTVVSLDPAIESAKMAEWTDEIARRRDARQNAPQPTNRQSPPLPARPTAVSPEAPADRAKMAEWSDEIARRRDARQNAPQPANKQSPPPKTTE